MRARTEAEREIALHAEEAHEIERRLEEEDQWHNMELARIMRSLGADSTRGLTSIEAAARLARDGPNELEQEEKLPLWKLFLRQFASLIIVLLFAACVASLALGEWVEGVAVIIIILLNATVATYSERSASNALEALARMGEASCVVIRDGERRDVPSAQLVRGDVLLLETGSVVPADVRLISATGFKVNEMLLTGEPVDVSKKATAGGVSDDGKLTPMNMAFSSTTCAQGHAVAVVVETGMDTRVGRIAALLNQSSGGDGAAGAGGQKKKRKGPKRTPLQQKLHKLGLLISTCALSACIAVFIVGTVRGHRDPEHPDNEPWLQMIMVSVSLAVSAIPEGLPLCVTICLALGTADMVKKNVLVRKLPAVETLGSAQVIATDKTGTLTEGRMTCVKTWVAGVSYDVSGKGFDPYGDIVQNEQSALEEPVTAPTEDGTYGAKSVKDAALRSLLQTCVLCCNTELVREAVQMKGEADRYEWVCNGNSSEAPLVVAAAKAGVRRDATNQLFPVVAQVPFSSSRKMMLTVHRVTPEAVALGSFGGSDLHAGSYLVCVKGAPNYVLNRCSSSVRHVDATGTAARVRPLAQSTQRAVTEQVDDMSSQALRVLAVAYRVCEQLPAGITATTTSTRGAGAGAGAGAEEAKEAVQTDSKAPTYEVEEDTLFESACQALTLLGLTASIDPERDGVKESVEQARTAGVRTVMVTGDYLKTAIAIARNVTILPTGADEVEQAADCSVLRPDGEYLADYEIDEITSRTLVFARAKPEDKIEIVKSFRRQGLVVCMTGDGVNDSPALAEADLGVAMGESGTDVAKGASDMILTDDNFSSLVLAIFKGRTIYSNIQKFITYLLGTNVGQVVFIFTSVLVGLPAPLSPLSILLVNLIVDGIPCLAISMEPGDRSVMLQRPRPRKQSIITGRIPTFIFGHALTMAAAVLGAFCVGLYWNTGNVLLDDILPEDVDENLVQCRQFDGDEWKTVTGDDCAAWGIQRARTMVFLCITISEILRGFTVRSQAPFWHSPFRNKALTRGIILSAGIVLMVVLTPGIKDIWGMKNIPTFMWGTSAAFALITVVMDEIIKSRFRTEDDNARNWGSMNDGFSQVLVELRTLRKHMQDMETKLKVREYKHSRRSSFGRAHDRGVPGHELRRLLGVSASPTRSASQSPTGSQHDEFEVRLQKMSDRSGAGAGADEAPRPLHAGAVDVDVHDEAEVKADAGEDDKKSLLH